jgi:HTH-type transcriptional regulator / antitoxin HipB
MRGKLAIIRAITRKRQLMDIAGTLRDRRKQLGLTQAEAAALAGVSPRFVYDLEKGKPSVALDRVLLLSEALGVQLKPELIKRG